jgi:acetyl-CoA carboxylase carboxyl transferase subunit beta
MRNLFRRGPTVNAGLWVHCENEKCRELLYAREFVNNLKVCPKCQHHARLTARERIEQLVDAGSFAERDGDLGGADPLRFEVADERYVERLSAATEKTGESDAAVAGTARIDGLPVELVVLDFAFMGASMGSTVGEKVARGAERAAAARSSLVTVSSSGGARMHEGIFALMQMAKTVTALTALDLPHISVLADPTLGGVTASYAGIGDVIIAEQGALVGFAGPRVIEQITKQKLPAEAQRASFLLEHGMVDMVSHRRDLRPTLAKLLRLYANVRHGE